jgi:hypothetical protein
MLIRDFVSCNYVQQYTMLDEVKHESLKSTIITLKGRGHKKMSLLLCLRAVARDIMYLKGNERRCTCEVLLTFALLGIDDVFE